MSSSILSMTSNVNREWTQTTRKADEIARRFLDILAAIFGLILLIPFFSLIGILIRRDSPGPVFYRGPRIGRGGRKFGILKFRTMYERSASYNGPSVTAQGDDRITPLGHWLRDTKVNELPQLWNVLVGDMSLVGPRPEDPDIAAGWPEETRKIILSVRPGVTSPASILYRDEEKLLSGENMMENYLQEILPSKMRLDTVYVRNRTILTDLDVIFWTLVALLPKVREKSIPKHLLYWGPVAQLFSRILNWFAADFFVAFCAVAVVGAVWRSGTPLNVGLSNALLLALGIAFLFSLINNLLGLNRISWSQAPANNAIDLAFSAAIMTSVAILFNTFIFNRTILPNALLVLTGLLSLLGFVMLRYRERILTGFASRWLTARRDKTGVGERVLIVGAGNNGSAACWLFRREHFSRLFNVAGLVDDDPRKVGMVVDGARILGTSEQIPELVQKYDIGLIVFAINRISTAQRHQIIRQAQQTNARLVHFPDLMALVCASLNEKPENAAATGAELHPAERLELTGWLNELDVILKNNDIEMARERLRQMRTRYAGD